MAGPGPLIRDYVLNIYPTDPIFPTDPVKPLTPSAGIKQIVSIFQDVQIPGLGDGSVELLGVLPPSDIG
jgi:hypothetical protein